jgi:hypothetical protein
MYSNAVRRRGTCKCHIQLAIGGKQQWYIYILLPAIQVQTLNRIMKINSLSVNDLTWQHSRKCEGRYGTKKLEPGQNIYYMHCW